MGRRPVKNKFGQERRTLAGLIDAALKAGQRGDAQPGKFRQAWTEAEFARTVNSNPSSVSEWRNQTEPTRPANIKPILDALYGDLPQYAKARRAMLTAWSRAGGLDVDQPPEPVGDQPPELVREIKSFSAVAEVASLTVNQPTRSNDGQNLILPYTLWLRVDQACEIPIIADGRSVTVTVDIGLTKPLLMIESEHWQPLQDTIFRGKRHANTAPGPVADCIWITGPTNQAGCIAGEPLEDEPQIMMERRGVDEDGQIALAVKVARDGISVTPSVGEPLTDRQRDVLDAIFAMAIPRDTRNRLEIARQVVAQPKPPEKQE